MTGGTNFAAKKSTDRSTPRKETAPPAASAASPSLPPPVWVFGYGSLIWKTNFPYEDRVVGRVHGYARKFWQGDVDHRGVPGAPGRVATLVQKEKESTWGVAYKVHASHVCSTITYLNTREQGYSLHKVTFYPYSGSQMPPMTVLVYIGTENSPCYLGPASEDNIAQQIISTRGCSGSNTDYVLNLASSMREIAPEVNDDHLFSLEAKILLLSSTLEKAGHSLNTSAATEIQSHNRDTVSVI